ncbi:hypothetical protein BD626DRAFT_485697 [Schizophyllum amplum]|uniref:Uncharacterized protein n=1 Tax=Schizophyllum amplum TaxID=97359 RepID=A0A550CLU4_9AGAR|nr:hypothetical protein BD626DRAFT_485697 [Auriculariopsis ampla]
MYPALREIQSKYLRWPGTERDISKSRDVKRAEHLLEHGVKLCDEKGISWTPRLK